MRPVLVEEVADALARLPVLIGGARPTQQHALDLRPHRGDVEMSAHHQRRATRAEVPCLPRAQVGDVERAQRRRVPLRRLHVRVRAPEQAAAEALLLRGARVVIGVGNTSRASTSGLPASGASATWRPLASV